MSSIDNRWNINSNISKNVFCSTHSLTIPSTSDSSTLRMNHFCPPDVFLLWHVKMSAVETASSVELFDCNPPKPLHFKDHTAVTLTPLLWKISAEPEWFRQLDNSCETRQWLEKFILSDLLLKLLLGRLAVIEAVQPIPYTQHCFLLWVLEKLEEDLL